VGTGACGGAGAGGNFGSSSSGSGTGLGGAGDDDDEEEEEEEEEGAHQEWVRLTNPFGDVEATSGTGGGVSSRRYTLISRTNAEIFRAASVLCQGGGRRGRIPLFWFVLAPASDWNRGWV
jgi:hypothetical protein